MYGDEGGGGGANKKWRSRSGEAEEEEQGEQDVSGGVKVEAVEIMKGIFYICKLYDYYYKIIRKLISMKLHIFSKSC